LVYKVWKLFVKCAKGFVFCIGLGLPMQNVGVGCRVQQGQDYFANIIVHMGLPSGLKHAWQLLFAKV
jgi:hypothetical protein